MSAHTVSAKCAGCGDVEINATDITIWVCSIPELTYFDFNCPGCDRVTYRYATATYLESIHRQARVTHWHPGKGPAFTAQALDSNIRKLMNELETL